MICQHNGKLTIKEIKELDCDSVVLINFYYNERFPNLHKWMFDENDNPLGFRLHGWEICKKLGKPNCHMQGWESYPGVWVFYDDHGIRWMVISDGIRRNHYKGTSYQVTLPDNITEEEFILAIKEFFAHFGFSHESTTG